MPAIDPNKPPELAEFSHLTIKGVLQTLSNVFGIQEPSLVFVSTSDRYRVAQRIAQMTAGADATVPYPIMFLHLMNVLLNKTPDDGAYNLKSLARMGRYTKRKTDNQTAYRRVTLVPTVYEMEVIYLDNDFFRTLSFTTQWMANAIQNRMNYTIEYYGIACDIRVEMSDAIATPDRDESVEAVNHYEYTSALRVFSYVQSDHMDDNAIVPALQQEVRTVTIEPFPPKDPMIYDPMRETNVKRYGN